MCKQKKNIILLGIIVLLILFFGGIIVWDSWNQLEMNNNEIMVQKAEWFWNKGEHEKAIRQLNIYLQTQHTVDDSTNAYELLKDYYDTIGKNDESAKCKRALAELHGKRAHNSNETVLSAANTVDYMGKKYQSGNVEIRPDYYDTSSMVLKITSSNLMPDNYKEGKIKDRDEELDKTIDAETSDWFDIYSGKKYLTISGGFNVSIWQFRDKENNIIDCEVVDGKYNDLESYYTGNSIWSTVEIPEKAVSARVTYWCGEKTTAYDNPICINYGTFPSYCEHAMQEIYLPDLLVGEKLKYDFSTGVWTMITETGDKRVSIPGISVHPGDTISLVGNSMGSITFENVEVNNAFDEGEYGVRWSIKNTLPIGERVGDAVGLDFGYQMGNNWIGTSEENDFDNIYPWCEIKRCNITDDGKIIYEGDSNFSTNEYDTMVEIPKFYVKREIKDGYEYIWISGKEKDGYTLDPAFIKNGKTIDKIYVGAYLAGFNIDNLIGSYDNTQPAINLSLTDVKKLISEKGDNWKALDYITLAMIQKLFLVESACRDSQALFMGVVNLSWGSCYATESSDIETNTIIIKDDPSSQKINVGDSITVFDVPQGSSYYSVLTQYKNNEGWDRTVISKTKLENENVQIEFSGESLVISEGITLIMNLPNKSGESDDLNYPTGQKSNSQDGNISFRYRYMENLWGSLCVMLDGINIENGNISITNADDETIMLDYELAEQTGTTSEGVSAAQASILSMGYDKNYPLYMLPVDVSNGASSITAYCDALFYEKSDSKLIMTYGLTWDLRQYAGLFGYRANITENEPKVESGSRLIYR